MSARRFVSIVSLLTILGCCLFVASTQETPLGRVVGDAFGALERHHEKSPEEIDADVKKLYAEITSADAQILMIQHDGYDSEKRFTVNGKLGTGPQAIEEIDRWLRLKTESGPVVFVFRELSKTGGYSSEDAPIHKKIDAIEQEQGCISIAISASSTSTPYFLFDHRTNPRSVYIPASHGIYLEDFVRDVAYMYQTDLPRDPPPKPL